MYALTSPRLLTPPRNNEDPTATTVELDVIIGIARRRGAHTIAIGSGRTSAALVTSQTLADRWQHEGGEVAATITWPETAASWLRQATRFAATDPDLWVMTGPATGWAQMTRRLLWSTTWSARRTLVTAALAARDTLELVGAHHLDGLAGAHTDGTPWILADGCVRPPREQQSR
ncbi:hypothetical protein ACIP5Y_23590 [Nocardia sp. NPDC088792]|uniref:hypothetical protein n=1 Tax=Nocardia sp. NPDC088792 TaxID=3364332 RepID=UPI0037F83A2C